MKIKIDEFEKLAQRKKYRNGKLLWKKLGGGKTGYALIKRGYNVTYEIVKELYNLYGEEETMKVVDFGEVTLNEFKAKNIEIAKKFC